MKRSWRLGFSFGLSSGVITTLGLMVGLYSGTGSKLFVIGGILTIAVADAFSESVSIHISQEFENKNSHNEIWESTLSTFLSKFAFSSLFIVPVLLIDSLQASVIICVLIGFYLLFLISMVIARERNVKIFNVVCEHLFIAGMVIFLTYYIGQLISSAFNC